MCVSVRCYHDNNPLISPLKDPLSHGGFTLLALIASAAADGWRRGEKVHVFWGWGDVRKATVQTPKRCRFLVGLPWGGGGVMFGLHLLPPPFLMHA